MDLTERAAHVRVVDRRHPVAARLGRPRVNAVVYAGEPAGGAEHYAFVVQLGGDQPPAAVLLTDEHVGRHAHIAVIGGVRVVRTVGQDHRGPGVTRILRVDDENRNALVLHRFRIGATGQPDVVGVVTTGGEDLLPVDDVLATMADRGRAQRAQVGA